MPELTIDALVGRVGELAETENEPSPHTVASYERRWRQWQRFADRHGIQPLPTPRQRRNHMNAKHISLVAVIVDDYDPAIEYFVNALDFELVEDTPALTNDGCPKRWVVVRPPGAQTGILLARADGERQAAAVGNQVAGRVGFFLHVDDFDAAYQRMTSAGVEFVTPPRTEPYGRLAVFLDIAGNRWDLLAPT